jgi:hypothetical protein
MVSDVPFATLKKSQIQQKAIEPGHLDGRYETCPFNERGHEVCRRNLGARLNSRSSESRAVVSENSTAMEKKRLRMKGIK